MYPNENESDQTQPNVTPPVDTTDSSMPTTSENVQTEDVAPETETPVVDAPIESSVPSFGTTIEPSTSYQPPVETSPVYQAPVAPAPAPVDMAQPSVQAVNPGKGWGIASLVTSLLSMGLLGLIFGLIGKNKSKKAGQKNGLATAGIVLGIINLVCVILVGVLFGAAIYKAVTNGDLTSPNASEGRFDNIVVL